MKKIFLPLIVLIAFAAGAKAQNIGINSTGDMPDKSAMLDVSSTTKGMLVPRMTTAQRTVIASPAKGLLVFDTDNNSFWFYNGTGWVDLSVSSGAGNWSLNGVNIFNNNAGNVGIGTNTPSEKLTILSGYDTYGLTLTDGDIKLSSYIGKGHGAWFGTQSNHPLHLYTNASGTPNVTFHQNFETDLRGPKSRLKFYDETSSLLLSGDVRSNGSNLEIAASKATGLVGQPGNLILQVDDASVIGLPLNGGKVGIGTNNPIDKLTVLTPTSQYGITHTDGNISVSTFVGGSTGGGWIGTRSNHSLSFFTNGSSPQMTLNTFGNVGINYSNPIAGYKLSVNGGTYVNGVFVNTGDVEMQSDAIVQGNLVVNSFLGIGGSPTVPIEVFSHIPYPFDPYSTGLCITAHGVIQVEALWTTSDSRIKNIEGISNSTLDLATINSIKITNYTLKDNMQDGHKSIKKIIAQQVEKVYPQIVNKNRGFIPNVYQLTDKTEKTVNGYLLSFSKEHNINNTAKKLQIFLSDERGMQTFEIISIPSPTQVLIKASEIKTNNIFVYGEEVDDFRTVDYDGLTTLNISATQELSKLIKKQQKKLDILQQEIILLGNQIRSSKQPQVKLSSLKQRSNSVKSKKLRS